MNEVLPHGAKPARQRRSQQLAAEIADTARRLLETRPFDELTVAEVARDAGTSVGGFYARFPDKQALLEAVDARVLDDIRDAFDGAMEGLPPAASFRSTVEAYVRVMVTQMARHRSAILQVRRHASVAGNAGYRARLIAFNDHVHERFRERLRPRFGELDHEDPEFAINFALFMVSAAAREAVLAGALKAYPIAVGEAQLVGELTSAFLAYVRIQGAT